MNFIIISLLNLITLIFISLFNFSARQSLLFIKTSLSLSLILICLLLLKQFIPIDPITVNLKIGLPATTVIAMTSHLPNHTYFYLSILYILGFSVMLLRIIFSFIKANNLLKDATHAIIQGQEVWLTQNINTPLCYGIINPKIYLPHATNLTEEQLMMCLLHEKHHIDKRDPQWKLVSLIVDAIFFFAPWSQVLHQRFIIEMEIECDTTVCKKVNVYDYAMLLINQTTIRSKNILFNHFAPSNLKRRLLSMKSKKTKKPLLFLTSISMLFLAGFTFAVNLPDSTNFDINSKIYLDGKLVASPRIITRANQPAYIEMSDDATTQMLHINMLAKNTIMGNINLKCDVLFRYGKEEIFSKEAFILRPNKIGTINLENTGHNFTMQILVKKQ